MIIKFRDRIQCFSLDFYICQLINIFMDNRFDCSKLKRTRYTRAVSTHESLRYECRMLMERVTTDVI